MTSPSPAPRDPDREIGTFPDATAAPDPAGSPPTGRAAASEPELTQPGTSGPVDEPGVRINGSPYPYATDSSTVAQPAGWPQYPGEPQYPGQAQYPDLETPTTLAPEPRPSARAKALVALVVAGIIALLGFLLGWMWSSFAPWLPGVKESDALYLQQPYGEQRAGQETWFILLSIGAGILVGIIVWVALRRFRGPLMVVALAVGGVAAGWIAWRFGHNIGRGHALAEAKTATIGQVVLVPPDLRIKQPGNIALWHGWLPYLSGVLLYVAIAAIVTYLLIASFTANPALTARRSDRRADQLAQRPVDAAATPHA